MNYAIFAKDAYNTNPKKPSPHPNYMVDSDLTTKNQSVYYNTKDKKVVWAIRGTDFSSLKDLKQDSLIVANNLEYSKRLKRLKIILKTIKEKYPDYDLIGTGHSLGGALLQKLIISKTKLFDEGHSYAPGTSPLELRDILTSKLTCLIYPKWCKKLKEKNYIYIVPSDPVSTISNLTKIELAKIKRVKAKFPKNPHTIDNYL